MTFFKKKKFKMKVSLVSVSFDLSFKTVRFFRSKRETNFSVIDSNLFTQNIRRVFI